MDKFESRFKQSDIVVLNRNFLGSIDLSQARYRKEYTEDERKNRNASIATIFNDIIKPDIEDLIVSQEEFIARQADGERQLDIGRGTINGFDLLLEHFKKMYTTHLAETNPESFDKYKVLADLTK